jgi:hypothetical protein
MKEMEKAYNIKQVSFESDFIILMFDNQVIKLKLSDVSQKLAKATQTEREDFKISPSGYGIHWRLLDEDLSINGLLSQ